MDPNANLFEQRELTKKMFDDFDHNRPFDADDVARLAELAQEMDSWLTRGGCLPTDWQPRS